MADYRAGSWVSPSGGYRAGAAVHVSLGAALAGTASGVASLLGAALTTGAGFSASGAAVASGAAALTDFSSVTISAPIYTGPGSVFDSRYWPGPTPQPGWVVYFESHGGFDVATSGEVSATVASGRWQVQVSTGSSVYVQTIDIISSDLMAIAGATSSGSATVALGAALSGSSSAGAAGTAAVTTQIRLVSGTSAVATGSAAALVAAVQLIGSGVAVASTTANAALQTAVRLVASASAMAQGSCTLGTGIRLSGSAAGVAAGTGAIFVAYSPLIAANAASAVGSAQLLSAIRLGASAFSMPTGGGSLAGPSLQVAGDGDAYPAAEASISTGIRLAAVGSAQAASSAMFDGTSFLAGGASTATYSRAWLSVVISFSNDPAGGQASGTGSLSVRARFNAIAASVALAVAVLSSDIQVSGSGAAQSSARAPIQTSVLLESFAWAPNAATGAIVGAPALLSAEAYTDPVAEGFLDCQVLLATNSKVNPIGRALLTVEFNGYYVDPDRLIAVRSENRIVEVI